MGFTLISSCEFATFLCTQVNNNRWESDRHKISLISTTPPFQFPSDMFYASNMNLEVNLIAMKEVENNNDQQKMVLVGLTG